MILCWRLSELPEQLAAAAGTVLGLAGDGVAVNGRMAIINYAKESQLQLIHLQHGLNKSAAPHSRRHQALA